MVKQNILSDGVENAEASRIDRIGTVMSENLSRLDHLTTRLGNLYCRATGGPPPPAPPLCGPIGDTGPDMANGGKIGEMEDINCALSARLNELGNVIEHLCSII